MEEELEVVVEAAAAVAQVQEEAVELELVVKEKDH